MSLEVTIRNSIGDDFQEVKRYFLDNLSDYNVARSDDVLLERIGQRKFVIIEQRGVGFVGVSGTFDYGEDGDYREAGATRITLNGFGFQRILHYARALHEFILDYSYAAYFGTVVDGNTRSIRNIESIGFEKWPDPDPLLVAEKAKASKPGRKVEYYRLPNARLVDHAVALLQLEANPVLQRPDRNKPGAFETARLTLDLEILNEHHPVVEQIAGGDIDIHD